MFSFLFAVILKIFFFSVDMKVVPDATTGNFPFLPEEQPLVSTNCTADQLNIIRHQLPSRLCRSTRRRPWRSICSFSFATRCPDHSSWLYLQDPRKENKSIVLFVGCNKAVDAVHALGRISRDPTFDLDTWRTAFYNGSAEVEAGRCGQDDTKAERIDNRKSVPNDNSIVYCIEPMPTTAEKLSLTANHLQWQDRLQVSNVAMAKINGTVWFPNLKQTVGVENMGMDGCSDWDAVEKRYRRRGQPPRKKSDYCKQVQVLSLDNFVQNQADIGSNDIIDFISVDVEGFDFDVILGGNETLRRTKYLEFEYNWKGPWRDDHSLSKAIDHLDRNLGFTCYWAGAFGWAWRITGCWLEYYDLKFWSNVACVHRKLDQGTWRRIEKRFQATLRQGHNISYYRIRTVRTDGREPAPSSNQTS